MTTENDEPKQEEAAETASTAEDAAAAEAADGDASASPDAADAKDAAAAPAKASRSTAEQKALKEKRRGVRKRQAAARQKAKERKPITRLPKPERARGRIRELTGEVVSSAGDKTIVVRVERLMPHRRYGKVIRRTQNMHAHDVENSAGVGDIVRIVESRRISKLKSWRLVEVMQVAE